MIVFLFLILLGGVFLWADFQGPEKVSLKPVHSFGFMAEKAKDLLVQEFDHQGHLWATRGFTIYRLKTGEKAFTRISRIPVGRSVFWLQNFSLIRALTAKTECLEMVVSADGRICAFAAGHLYFQDDRDKRFRPALKLVHFGWGVGRGILNSGILRTSRNRLFVGEYFRNEKRAHVKIFRSDDFGASWSVAHEFGPGEIRHIHSLQQDPYTDRLWVCTGDTHGESMIGWSDDEYKTIHPLGKGSQLYRTCRLVFSGDAIYWGADTGLESCSGIYSWNKVRGELTRLKRIQGAVLQGTRLREGTIVMGTDREGFPNEQDDSVRLFIISGEHILSAIECGTWKNKRPGFRFRFAKVRFQRNQDSNWLAANFINQKEVCDGDLFFISEALLKS